MLTWSDFPQVEMDFMNNDHEECIQLITELVHECKEADIGSNQFDKIDSKLEGLKKHLVEHFQREEEAMEETNFPPYYVHKTEHDSTLQQFQQVVTQWIKERNLDYLIRYISNNMMNWLETHALTMDTVTAQHIARSS